MFCPKCGKQIPDTARFCGGCGNSVTPLPGGAKEGGRLAPKPEKMPKMEKPAKAPKPPKPEKPRKEPDQGGNSRAVLILGIVLAVLVFVAIGMGAYYFIVVQNEGHIIRNEADKGEETEEEPESEGDDVRVEEDGGAPASEEMPGQEENADEDKVVSDTNEVAAGKILENIPKAVYSYQFDGGLDGAEVVVREQPETEPELADDSKAQYVRGMDGEAVLLDGSYGLKLDNVESLGDSYTVAFWMNAKELYDWAPFIHVGRALFDEKERCRLWIGQKPDGDGGSTGPILSSERASANDSVEIRPEDAALPGLYKDVWYHIAFTVEGSAQGSQSGRVLGTLYLAGEKAGQGDVVVDAMSGDDFDVYLGINCWDQLYPVAFDDVKIWNQALSGEQITELFQAYE